MASSGYRVLHALALFAVVLALVAAGAGRAQAQMGIPGFGTGTRGGGANAHPATGEPQAPPPVALPGAAPTGEAAPAAQLPASMNPTEELFDAINRNDLAAARSAINRGADLNGRNVLGMTPIELSIDLGRNPITFLLLSMRGGEPEGPPGAKTALGTGAGSGKPAGGKATAGHTAARSAAHPATHPVARTTAPPHPIRKPARVAQEQPSLPVPGHGGTPVPTAGFLGFAPSR